MTPPTTQPPSDASEREAWTAWADERPTDTTALYRWRIPAKMILGLMLRPEWSGKLTLCGMGYADSEWWPEGSHWNGYSRKVHPGLEWRLAEPGEIETVWHGLDLLPDPWTGMPPRVDVTMPWIGAPIYEAKSFSISHRFGTSNGWTDAAKLMAAWNSRAASISTDASEREEIARIIERYVHQVGYAHKAADAIIALQSSRTADTARLDWLEMQCVEVRTPLVHGSLACFRADPDDSYEGEDRPSDLRARIDAARNPGNPSRQSSRTAGMRGEVERLRAVISNTRRLVSAAAENGFTEEEPIRALFLNQQALTAALNPEGQR